MFSHSEVATPVAPRKAYDLPLAIMPILNEAFAASPDAHNAYYNGKWSTAAMQLRRDGLVSAAFALEINTPYLYDR